MDMPRHVFLIHVFAILHPGLFQFLGLSHTACEGMHWMSSCVLANADMLGHRLRNL